MSCLCGLSGVARQTCFLQDKTAKTNLLLARHFVKTILLLSRHFVKTNLIISRHFVKTFKLCWIFLSSLFIANRLKKLKAYIPCALHHYIGSVKHRRECLHILEMVLKIFEAAGRKIISKIEDSVQHRYPALIPILMVLSS